MIKDLESKSNGKFLVKHNSNRFAIYLKLDDIFLNYIPLNEEGKYTFGDLLIIDKSLYFPIATMEEKDYLKNENLEVIEKSYRKITYEDGLKRFCKDMMFVKNKHDTFGYPTFDSELRSDLIPEELDEAISQLQYDLTFNTLKELKKYL